MVCKGKYNKFNNEVVVIKKLSGLGRISERRELFCERSKIDVFTESRKNPDI
jgi:hypothetical protein